MSSEVVKNLLKLPRVKAPFASVNAYMAIITSGRTTNISMKMKYGRDQYDLLNVLISLALLCFLQADVLRLHVDSDEVVFVPHVVRLDIYLFAFVSLDGKEIVVALI